MQATHVLQYSPVFSRVGGSRVHAHTEGAEAIELHNHRVLQLVVHHLHQLSQHCYDVALLHGTVALHDGGQLFSTDGAVVLHASVPFAVKLVATFCLIKFVIYCHNVFSFL